MRKRICCFLGTSLAALICGLRVLAAAESPDSVHVDGKDKYVKQDGEFDPDRPPAQEIDAQTIRRFTRAGTEWLRIASKTLLRPIQPRKMLFRRFSEVPRGKGGYPYEYVDIVGSGVVGVVVGPDGKPIEGREAIKVFQVAPAPTDAGTFPFGAEGNLKLEEGQPGVEPGVDYLFHWRAKFKDTSDNKMEISCVPSYVVRGETLQVLGAKALDENGRAKAGVGVTCVVNTYSEETSLGELRTLDLGETSVLEGPDKDPRVEMPNPNLAGTPAEATEYEFVVSGQGGGVTYESAKMRIPIVAAEWIVNKELKGFDGSCHPPRMVVGAGNESDAAKLKLGAGITPVTAVSIGGTNKEIATIRPDPATGILTVTPVKGESHGVTQAKATKDGVLATLDITVVKKKEYTIIFCEVVDTAEPPHSGVLDGATRDNIQEKSKALRGDQANVTLTFKPPQVVQYEGNLGAAPDMNKVFEVINSENCPRPEDNEIVVLVFHDVTFDQGAAGYHQSGYAIVRKIDVAGRILAHEIGHEMLGHSCEDGNLMASGRDTVGGEVIRPYEVDYIKR